MKFVWDIASDDMCCKTSLLPLSPRPRTADFWYKLISGTRDGDTVYLIVLGTGGQCPLRLQSLSGYHQLVYMCLWGFYSTHVKLISNLIQNNRNFPHKSHKYTSAFVFLGPGGVLKSPSPIDLNQRLLKLQVVRKGITGIPSRSQKVESPD